MNRTFQNADKIQIVNTIEQIKTHNPNEENHDDEFAWNELKTKMERLVEIVQSWNGQVGILRCHEPEMNNNDFQFRIYPVSYYDPKILGNRRNKNATHEQVNFHFPLIRRCDLNCSE